MRCGFLALASVLTLSSGLMAASPGDKVAAQIVANGHRRVAVLPMVISRNGDVEGVGGELGARGPLMAHELYKKLVSASQQGQYKGKFQVVPERNVRIALKSRNLKAEDLADPKKLGDLSEATGADIVAALNADDLSELGVSVINGKEKETFDVINAETLDPKDGFVTSSQDFADDRTLGKAAYAGESWELRRWVDGKLTNVGIDLDGKKAFGQGTKWEKWQYERIKSDVSHPLEIADFPYLMNIQVNGQTRSPVAKDGVHGTQYVAALEPGEVYTIELENQSDKPVFVALYIDGVSSIDKLRVEPEDLESSRHWYLGPKSGKRKIAGWYTIERDENKKVGKTQYYNEFKIVPRSESVGAGLGLDSEIGMITAIFYTVGMDGIDTPDDSELKGRGLPRAEFGTGLGDRKDKSLEFPAEAGKSRGIMLGAYTLYYRTQQQIDGIGKEGGESENDLAFLPDNDE